MDKLFNKKNIEYVLSGSCAIITVLKSNLKENSKVLIPDNVCARVLESILLCNLVPVIVSPKNGLTIEDIDVSTVKEKVDLDAVILVHNYGLESNTKLIKENNKDLLIIEDCAQYWGNNYEIGLYSDYVITSIDTNKPLHGRHLGIILSDNDKAYLDKGVVTRYSDDFCLPFSTTKDLTKAELSQTIKKATINNIKYNKYIEKLNKILNKYSNIIYPNKECNNLKYAIIFKKKRDYDKFIKLSDLNNFQYSEPHIKSLEELPMINKFKYYYIKNCENYKKNQLFIKMNNLSNKYIIELNNILEEVFND